MSVLFYSPLTYQSSDRLRAVLDEIVAKETVEAYHDLTGLMHRIRKSSADLRAVIVMPGNRNELLALFSILNELRDARLVLVLPDRDNETIAMAHQFRPRYLSYVDGDYHEVREVLRKMLKEKL